MGGNALSKPSIRVNKEKFIEVSKEIHGFLKKNGVASFFPRQLPFKTDFGDLDVVIPSSADKNRLETALKEFSPELVKNGPVWSFDYNGFQVDLVSSPYPAFTADWMDFNDTQNLVGRLIHKLGMKNGHDGMTLPVWVDDTFAGEILLTIDLEKVHSIVGLDHEVWEGLVGYHELDNREPFYDFTSVYEWLSESPYFNPDIFLLDNRNAKSRIRDAKRPMYTGLLRWIQEKNPPARFHFNKDKSVYLPLIFKMFPDAEVEYNKMVAKTKHLKAVRDAWTTLLPVSWVMETFGYSGKELGRHLTGFRATLTDSQILAASGDELKHLFRKYNVENQN